MKLNKTAITLPWLDRLGDWNPQIFRELKGQLTVRNISLAVASSLIGQFILFSAVSQKVCNRYVGYDCTEFWWKIDWGIIFKCLNWTLPFLAIAIGLYMLVENLAQEERRGTLNFIRLSPQSSQSILSGKLLGVPILVYLAIALAIPLHLISALFSGVPFLRVVGIYTLWGVGCSLFYTTACLYTLMYAAKIEAKSLAGGAALVSCLLALPYIGALDFSLNLYKSGANLGTWKWFLLPVANAPILVYSLTVISIGMAAYWFWQAANRCFYANQTSLLSKSQSYWLVASFELWLLGFVLPEIGYNTKENPLFPIGGLFLFVLTPLFFLILIAALSPGRQALLDWSRYRRDTASGNFWNRALWQDLVWAEKSPAIVAIAINFLITSLVWIPWILLWPSNIISRNFKITAILGLILTLNAILIYAAIFTLRLLLKPQIQLYWLVGIAGIILFPLVSWHLGTKTLAIQFLLLFSPFPVLLLASNSALTVFLSLSVQMGVLGLLGWQLKRQLQKAGESNSKALFNTKSGSITPF